MFVILDNTVDVVQFVQTKCLSYLFASLSSECKQLRSLSYACIYRFASHLESNYIYIYIYILFLYKLMKSQIFINFIYENIFIILNFNLFQSILIWC